MKTLLLLLFPIITNAQRVFVTHNINEANKLVYMCDYFTDAHLVIKRTYDVTLPERNTWFFVTSAQAADSGWVIYYVKDYKKADFRVYFTRNNSLLGEYTPGSELLQESLSVTTGKKYRIQQKARKQELQSWIQ